MTILNKSIEFPLQKMTSKINHEPAVPSSVHRNSHMVRKVCLTSFQENACNPGPRARHITIKVVTLHSYHLCGPRQLGLSWGCAGNQARSGLPGHWVANGHTGFF